MRKVKFFEIEMPENGELSQEINDFIEKNSLTLVDVKISTILTIMDSHMLMACVTYDED